MSDYVPVDQIPLHFKCGCFDSFFETEDVSSFENSFKIDKKWFNDFDDELKKHSPFGQDDNEKPCYKKKFNRIQSSSYVQLIGRHMDSLSNLKMEMCRRPDNYVLAVSGRSTTITTYIDLMWEMLLSETRVHLSLLKGDSNLSLGLLAEALSWYKMTLSVCATLLNFDNYQENEKVNVATQTSEDETTVQTQQME